MPNTNDLLHLSQYVLWLTLTVTILLGALMQWSSFCTMGAVSDMLLMSDYTRMRQWSLAIGVAIVGVAVLASQGYIDTSKSIYTSNRFLYLSTIIGSLCFGFGMVLASGCGSKTLIRIGGGNLKAVVVFFVLGSVAYMTLKGFLAVLRVNTIDMLFLQLSTTQDLPSIFAAQTSMAKAHLQLILGLLIGGAFILFALLKKSFWQLDNLLAGAGVGLAIIAIWWVSGHLGFIAEDPKTLEEVFLVTNSGRMESLSFVAPYAYTLDWLILFSDTSKVLTLGIVAVGGMIIGAFLSAILTKTFRWETFHGVEDTGNHLLGAALMGFGGVTALGCTIGQGLSGVSTLALSAFLALPGFIGGACLGLWYLQWRLERQLN